MQAAAADLKLQIPDADNAKDIIGLGLEAVLKLFPELQEESRMRWSNVIVTTFCGEPNAVHPLPRCG